MRPAGAPHRIVFIVPEGFHLLDVTGPLQAFSAATEILAEPSSDSGDGPGPGEGAWADAEAGAGYAVELYADVPLVESAQGVRMGASPTLPVLTADDLLMVPGWRWHDRRTVPLTEPQLSVIADHHAAGGDVASVCAGAFALAKAGVLGSVPGTTHHELVSELARLVPGTVERDVLYTCAERVHTSAGISSGIDLALHLIAHHHGSALAARVARALVVPAWRPGGGSQTPVTLLHRNHMQDLVHRVQDVLDAADGPPLPLDRLAARFGVSGRTLARAFRSATGLTPHAYGAAVRRERAEQLVSQGWTREAAAREVGYADARSLRRR